MGKKKHGHHEDRGKRIVDTMLEASGIVGRGLPLEETLCLLLEQLATLVEYDSASILAPAGDGFKIVAGRGYPRTDDVVGRIFRPSENQVIRDLVDRFVPVVIGDVTKEPGWQTVDSTRYIRSWLGVPLLLKDELVGILSIDKEEAHCFNERTTKLTLAFANHAALAIANRRAAVSSTPSAPEPKPLVPRGAITIDEPVEHKPVAYAESGEALLFGAILVQNKLATPEQVEESLHVQRQLHETGIPMKLGAIMFEKGYITVDALYAALMMQRERYAIDSDPLAFQRKGLTTEADLLLGEWAISHGMITRPHLDEALSIQKSIRALGVKSKRIGEILVDKGHLAPEALLRWLEERGGGQSAAASPSPSGVQKTLFPIADAAVGPAAEAAAVPVRPAPEKTLADAIHDAAMAPTKPRDRSAALSQELRAAQKRLVLGFIVAGCVLVAIVYAIVSMTDTTDKDVRQLRSAYEKTGYSVPVVLPAKGADAVAPVNTTDTGTSCLPAEAQRNPLEQAQQALDAALPGTPGGRAVLVGKYLKTDGGHYFLLAGCLPGELPVDGSVSFKFNGRPIPEATFPISRIGRKYTVAAGPISPARQLVPGIYAAHVDLRLDISGATDGSTVYVRGRPDALAPPAIGLPMRFSFLAGDSREASAAREGVRAAIGECVGTLRECAAELETALDRLERSPDPAASMPDWEEQLGAVNSRIDAVIQAMHAVRAGYWACPCEPALEALAGLIATARVYCAKLAARASGIAGSRTDLPTAEITVGGDREVLVAGENDPTGRAAFQVALQKTEDTIAGLATMAVAPEDDAAREYLEAVRSSLLTACQEAVALSDWIGVNARGLRARQTEWLSTLEQLVWIWRRKVAGLPGMDQAVARLANDGAGAETLSRLTQTCEAVTQAGTGIVVDALYEAGFAPSAELAAQCARPADGDAQYFSKMLQEQMAGLKAMQEMR